MTPEVISKLEEAFAFGCTDIEACLYAGIGKATLYKYQEQHPEFVDRKEELKERPVLLARQTVIKSLTSPQTAQWYLERKRKDEFSSRVENTGKDGEPLIPKPILGDLEVPTNSGKPHVLPAHDSNQENSKVIEADQGSTGGNVSQQDNLDSTAADPGSPEGSDTNPDLGSKRISPPS